MRRNLISPAGFTQIDDDVVGFERKDVEMLPNLKLDNIFELFANRQVNTDSFSYRASLLREAKNCIGPNFAQWVRRQELNPHLYGLNYEFLLDTLEFIRTGKRKVSVINWFELTIDFPQHKYDEAKYRSPSSIPMKLFSEVGDSTPDIFTAWLQKPNGFEDMLCTMHVLFGNCTAISNIVPKADDM